MHPVIARSIKIITVMILFAAGFYRIVDDEYISVARVIDGRQDYMAILFGEQRSIQ